MDGWLKKPPKEGLPKRNTALRAPNETFVFSTAFKPAHFSSQSSHCLSPRKKSRFLSSISTPSPSSSPRPESLAGLVALFSFLPASSSSFSFFCSYAEGGACCSRAANGRTRSLILIHVPSLGLRVLCAPKFRVLSLGFLRFSKPNLEPVVAAKDNGWSSACKWKGIGAQPRQHLR